LEWGGKVLGREVEEEKGKTIKKLRGGTGGVAQALSSCFVSMNP
jgi:hypothetical protein